VVFGFSRALQQRVMVPDSKPSFEAVLLLPFGGLPPLPQPLPRTRPTHQPSDFSGLVVAGPP
jgi:hypothetical protein